MPPKVGGFWSWCVLLLLLVVLVILFRILHVQTSNQIQISAMQIYLRLYMVCALAPSNPKVLNAKVKFGGTPKCMTSWPYFST